MAQVIIFGPTGAVGAAAARTAEELGAKVVLAMRDPDKPTPGLAGRKVRADLTQPDTVREAAAGSKRAFIYEAHASDDHMRATIEALKAAGIEQVVFLSSLTVRGFPATIPPPSKIIPFMHAQVEANLNEVFGPAGYVPIRPGVFASNFLAYKPALKSGTVELLIPEATVDCIVPEDIGRVCGTILVNGQQDKGPIFLYGPRLIPQREVFEILAKALGRDIRIESTEDSFKLYTGMGIPPLMASYSISQMNKMRPGRDMVFGCFVDKAHLNNVQKYSGRPGTTFEEWVEKNKQLF